MAISKKYPLFDQPRIAYLPAAKESPWRIPLAVPCLDEAEEAAVLACVRSGWVSAISPMVKTFEQRFADTVGAPHAVATQSGTSAIHLALLALGIGPGDEVIVPALSFVATVNPVRYVGATPVFVDLHPKTLGLDPAQVAAAVTPHTKAILVTHLYGLLADVPSIAAAAPGIPIIEDAAEALGSTLAGQYAGTLGCIGCFSFNGNKTITCGSGGMVVTADEALARRVLHLSTQARETGEEFSHDAVGYNLRMNGLQAAMGLAQLDKLPTFLQRKQAIAQRYQQALQPLAELPTGGVATGEASYWLSTLLTEGREARQGLIAAAKTAGIEMRSFFKPLPMLRPYQTETPYPVAESLWQRGVCLPSSVSLTEAQQGEVIALVQGFLRACKKDF